MTKERNMVFITGKAGMIDCEEALWRKCGFTEERIKELREAYEKNSPEGRYYMDGLVWEYLG